MIYNFKLEINILEVVSIYVLYIYTYKCRIYTYLRTHWSTGMYRLLGYTLATKFQTSQATLSNLEQYF